MGHNLRFQQSGTQLIFLFESSGEKLLQSVFHQGISPWPLIGDPERKIYNLYGVERSTTRMIRTMVSSNVSRAKKYTREFNLPEDKQASMNRMYGLDHSLASSLQELTTKSRTRNWQRIWSRKPSWLLRKISQPSKAKVHPRPGFSLF